MKNKMKIEIIEKEATQTVELHIDNEMLMYWTKEFEFDYQAPTDLQVYGFNLQMEMMHPLVRIIRESKYPAGVRAEAIVVLLERLDNKSYLEKDKKEVIEIITKDLETPV